MPTVRVINPSSYKGKFWRWDAGEEVDIPLGKGLKQLVEDGDVVILRPAPKELKTRCGICLHKKRRWIEKIYDEAGGYRETEKHLKELEHHNEKSGKPFAIHTIHVHFKCHPRLEDIEAKYPKPPEGLDIREAEIEYGRSPPELWWQKIAKSRR